ncbi:MAG: antitoxin Xre/MbcA/ParS toxin-binding domain-containing protein [Pseudomonadota bacterium]|nr:antitoxin Xre/MbcA/ParS toxin-binding domain-containing protein [Pseudomonadota bacterium]MEA3240977.1 antitoxin Xre/MbcA/ParS toxin-binding domain-containing protein [Pseudomonadota bacterium]
MSTQIATLLGDELASLRIENPLDIINASQKGLTKAALIHVGRFLSLNQRRLADIGAISLRTFQRYDDNKKLNPVVSENIIQLAEIIKLGMEVFNDRDTFLKWLTEPNKVLRKKTPIELLKFRTGCDLVRNLMGQIQHGIVA